MAPPPPLTADNPASPSAPEATVRPFRNALGVDDLTKKNRQILAQAAKLQQKWDQSGPVSGDQQMPRQQASPTPTPQPHQMDQMPGMKMPQEQSQPSPTPNN
jgi:hypothetical protein